MSPEETLVPKHNPILDKPVHLLTEADISQLTREDCRLYLKRKGMRRPSWNKAQVIQQVLSLKRLLEPTPEGESSPPRETPFLPPYNLTPLPIAPRGRSLDLQLSDFTEGESHERYDWEKPIVSGFPAAATTHSISPRNRGSDNIRIGQMTVFYSGKVNVYDDIPRDQAQAILHVAASQLPLPPLEDILATQPGCNLLDTITKFIAGPTAFPNPTSQTVKVSEKPKLVGEGCKSPDEYAALEGLGSRKASVQRFLEKKKDRCKRHHLNR